jgi:hypothetical protein
MDFQEKSEVVCPLVTRVFSVIRLEQWEPYEVRASRTVLREARGAIPLAYSPPHHPDPKSLPFEWHLLMQYLWIYPTLICIFLFPVALVVLSAALSSKTKTVLGGSYVATWVLLIILWSYPPVDFLNWFLD